MQNANAGTVVNFARMALINTDTFSKQEWETTIPDTAETACHLEDTCRDEAGAKVDAALAELTAAVAATGNTALAAAVEAHLKNAREHQEEVNGFIAMNGAVAGYCVGRRNGLRAGVAATRNTDPAHLLRLAHALTGDDAAADTVLVECSTIG